MPLKAGTCSSCGDDLTDEELEYYRDVLVAEDDAYTECFECERDGE